MFDSKFCRALLGIARSYPEVMYAKTNVATVSASVLGRRRLDIPIGAETPPREADILIDHAALVWNALASHYGLTSEPFPHIYALLFFLEVLSIGRKLLYRGQFNGDWDLETTLDRKLKEAWDPSAINEAKRHFIDQVHILTDRRHIGLVGPELDALCQHYGFPTYYLDFTWSSVIAAFFALGGNERYSRPAEAQYPAGAIWVVDVMGDSGDALELVTLPAQVMRPWLQRGEFLNYEALKSSGTRPKIAKFVFRHEPDIWVEELFDLGPYSVAPLSMYLIPRRDPLEETAAPILERLIKEQEERNASRKGRP